jgi:uncharacterized glyoxalase superfamily protein PhnB
MKNIIGIQQVGVGVPDVQEAFSYYRKVFGMDIPVFQESAEAKLMTKYTGGKVQSRSAILAINMQGGSGFEIWQYTSRKTEKATFDIKLGDFGLYISRIKSRDVAATYQDLKQKKVNLLSDIQVAPNGEKHFYVKDIYDNMSENGMLILSDKMAFTEDIESLYHNFKRSNGVTEDEIKSKKQSLIGVLNTKSFMWYLNTMEKIGFRDIQIINANMMFNTLYARK